MISNSSSPLRLRIWRPCRWNKEYLDTKDNSLADMGAYQECLYSWEPFGDPFGSVTSSEQTQRLREELMEKFALAKPVQERGIKQFKQVISVIDEILSNKDESSWSDSEESRQLSNGESIKKSFVISLQLTLFPEMKSIIFGTAIAIRTSAIITLRTILFLLNIVDNLLRQCAFLCIKASFSLCQYD
jgi:hypothetical protein